MKKYILIPLLIIILSNFIPFKIPFILLCNQNYYKYSNKNGTFTYTNGLFQEYNSVSSIMGAFINFESANNTAPDTLYRIFKKNPFTFWRWYDYLTLDEYKLPYKNWEEIKKRRGENYIKNKQFQAF